MFQCIAATLHCCPFDVKIKFKNFKKPSLNMHVDNVITQAYVLFYSMYFVIVVQENSTNQTADILVEGQLQPPLGMVIVVLE